MQGRGLATRASGGGLRRRRGPRRERIRVTSGMAKRGFGRGFAAGLTALAAGGLQALAAAPALAADLVGQPTPGSIGLQPGVTPLRHEATFFHDAILLPIIVGISLFVLFLLAYVVVKFNAKANPTPARFTHNTTVEIIWTAAPVLILMFIAIFSFRLLFDYHNMPKPDVTVKATGNQWYWSYEYPSAGVPEYTSNPLPQAKAEAQGKGLYRLAVDNPMVVPVNKTVQVLVTGADVIHAFFVPAFGTQVDSVPGRVNQTWFKAEKVGTYYGQCNELCGVNHSFMPIQVNVVTQPEYDAWIAAHAKKTAAAAGPAPASNGGPAPAPGAAPAKPGPDATVGPVGNTTTAATGSAPAPAAQTRPRGVAKTPGAPKAATPANPASPA